MKIPRVAIIGSGISGLSNAFHLQKAFAGRCQVRIFEGSPNVGGAIKTTNKSGFQFEEGPRSIRNSSTVFELLKICEEINILNKIVPSANFENVFIYYDDQLRQLPRKLSAMPIARFLRDHPKLIKSLFDVQLRKGSNFSMEEFVSRKLHLGGILDMTGLSSFINTYLLNAFSKGVYRAESSNLSAELCLKKVYLKGLVHDFINPSEFQSPSYSDELKHFVQTKIAASGSFNFEEGLQTLPKELAAFLERQTDTQINLNTNVSELNFNQASNQIKIHTNGEANGEEFDYVVSTLNSDQLSKLLSHSQGNESRISSLRRDLDSIRQLPMLSMNFGYTEEVIPEKLRSFGYLIPSVAQQQLIGVVFDSCSYPSLGQKRGSRISLMFGDNFDADNKSDKQCVEAGVKELHKHTGIDVQPEEASISRWPPAFTEYSVGHFTKSQRMIATAARIHPHFMLHGKYLFTSAIPELILLSKCFAQKIAISASSS